MRWSSLVILFCLLAGAARAEQAGAVILIYHHVADDTPASTSVTPAQFARHLEYLDDNGFTVLPLRRVIDHFAAGEALPDRTAVITFDDGYASVLHTAAPMLAARGWPFSVFIATDAIDRRQAPYLDWAGIRALVEAGATIENHGAAHGHLVRREQDEDEAGRRRRIVADIEKAQRRIVQETGEAPRLFAFPYGEFDPLLSSLVRRLGLVPVGQHSGAAHAGQLDTALMRFPVNRRYAGLDSLADKLRSLPLPVERMSPPGGVLAAGDTRPVLRFRWPAGIDADRGQLRCFVSGQPPAQITWDGDVASVRATQPLRPGRSKYNCTAPARSQPGRFRWFSALWMLPLADGTWYPE